MSDCRYRVVLLRRILNLSLLSVCLLGSGQHGEINTIAISNSLDDDDDDDDDGDEGDGVAFLVEDRLKIQRPEVRTPSGAQDKNCESVAQVKMLC